MSNCLFQDQLHQINTENRLETNYRVLSAWVIGFKQCLEEYLGGGRAMLLGSQGN